MTAAASAASDATDPAPGSPPIADPPAHGPAASDGAAAPTGQPRPGVQRARRGKPARPRQARPRLVETSGPDSGTPLAEVRLVVGTIAGAHGVRGEAKLRLVTDDPEHLSQIKRIYLGEETEPRHLLGLRIHAGKALIRIQGVTTPEAVDALRGQPVRIAGRDARPPTPGEYFLYQLIGLEAVDEAGTRLGRVTDVMETGAHDIFIISPTESGPDLLLPNHPDVVLDVQPEAGRMIVRPLVYG